MVLSELVVSYMHKKYVTFFTQSTLFCNLFTNILQLNLIRINFHEARNFRLHFLKILFSNIISHMTKTRKCFYFFFGGGECFSNESSVDFSVSQISFSLRLLLQIIFGTGYVVIKFYKT